MKPDTILLPIDFSEPSFKAFRYGLELARRFEARAHLLYVTEQMMFYSPSFGGFMPTKDQYDAYAESGLQAAADTELAQGIEITREHRFGNPQVEIVKCAREQQVALIVMGTHGQTGLLDALTGSVAVNVVRHAHCPVLTVHAEQHEFIE